MKDKILEINNIGKCYKILLKGSKPSSLREMITEKSKRFFSKTSETNKTEFWALKDINLKIFKGEKVGIIGKNGAGKSTLLKLISRITKPTEGHLTITGRVASLLEVGTGFHPELSGKENIFLNASILGMTRQEIYNKYDEIAAFSEIGDFLDTPVKRYSSGMYVKLAFAIAAHINPDLLIIDEVLAVGDLTFQKKCLGRMNDLQRDGRTILFVSHNMTMVQEFCNRTLLLDNGRLIADGNPVEILSKYSDINESEKSGFIDLSEHRGRIINTTPCLKSLQLRNIKLEKQGNFFQNESIVFDISYAHHLDLPLAGIKLWINSLSGIRIGEISTFSSQSEPFNIPQKGIVRFIINANFLLPNKYTIRISVNGHQSNTLDSIEDIIIFEIKPSDVFKNGYIMNSSQGFINLPGESSILEEN